MIVAYFVGKPSNDYYKRVKIKERYDKYCDNKILPMLKYNIYIYCFE